MTTKMYDLAGINTNVELGKNGLRIKSDGTKVSVKNNADDALVRLEVMSGLSGNDAVNYTQLATKLDTSSVVTDINSSAGTVADTPTVKSYVDTSIAGLVDSAPGTLDTLNELAAALGDDANFATTVTNSIAAKQDTLTAGTGIDITGSTISVDADATEITADDTGHNYATGATVDAQISNLDTQVKANADAIAGSNAIGCRKLSFNYNDGATVNIGAVIPSGAIVRKITLAITTPFNDIAATLSVGTSGDADAYMLTTENDAQDAGTYEVSRLTSLGADTQAALAISAGTSTQGAGMLIIDYC
jgi:hypothetical protein